MISREMSPSPKFQEAIYTDFLTKPGNAPKSNSRVSDRYGHQLCPEH